MPHGRILGSFEIKRLPTVNELAEMWKKSKKGNLQTVDKGYRNLELHVLPIIGEVVCSELKKSTVQELFNSLNLSHSGKTNVLSPLRQAFKIAVDDELLSSNPCMGIELGKKNTREAEPFSVDELQQILANSPEYWRHVFEISFFTGMSNHEQFALKWEDVDFNSGMIWVRRGWDFSKGQEGDTKNKYRVRRIPMIARVYEALSEIRKMGLSDEYIFINPNTSFVCKEDAIHRAWRAVFKKVNVKYRTFYQTRHTFASLLLNTGMPMIAVKDLMGHSDTKMLDEVYGKYMEHPEEHMAYVKKAFTEALPNGIVPKLYAKYFLSKNDEK